MERISSMSTMRLWEFAFGGNRKFEPIINLQLMTKDYYRFIYTSSKINKMCLESPTLTLLELLFVLSVFRVSPFSGSSLPYAPASAEQLTWVSQNTRG